MVLLLGSITYWQLAEISNMKDVLEEIDRLEAEKLSIANAPIREKIESSLQIEVKQKTTRESDWGMTRFVILTFEIEYLFDSIIESIDGLVYDVKEYMGVTRG